jgi:hypothetical protein
MYNTIYSVSYYSGQSVHSRSKGLLIDISLMDSCSDFDVTLLSMQYNSDISITDNLLMVDLIIILKYCVLLALFINICILKMKQN